MYKNIIKSSVCTTLICMFSVPVYATDVWVPIGSGGDSPVPVTCGATSVRENETAARATNATRRAHGLSPLAANAVLAVVAARHACDMARRSVMTHRGSRTRGPLQRLKRAGYRPGIAAENIAAGPWGQERVLTEWVHSRGHLDNILLPQVRHYGIGRALGADGKTVFWAAVFSAPQAR